MERERSIQKLIRMNEEEWIYIEQKMKTSTIKKFQHFALMMLIQGEVSFTDYIELRKLVYEVKKIGANINQVTRLANQFSEISTSDIQKLTQTIVQLTDLVEIELQHQQEFHGRRDL